MHKPGTGWSRTQIESAIRRLILERLAIENFNWSDRFVEDLRID